MSEQQPMSPRQRQRWAIFGLTGPAYAWLAVTIFLPLSAMLYCSLIDTSPLVPRPASFTLANYAAFFQKSFYLPLTWWSILLGFWTTLFCFIIGYPAAYALANDVAFRTGGRPALEAQHADASQAMLAYRLP